MKSHADQSIIPGRTCGTCTLLQGPGSQRDLKAGGHLVDLGEIADDELIATFQGFDGRPSAAKNKRTRAQI